ncbi:MAG: threonylcarbamoyl-AMP synthase [Clostridiales bacterium]|nr:threonylcarbamoyl-AMP synthase [Clostridiales bacterium]
MLNPNDTKILSTNDENIRIAARLIQNGDVVAMPTETVYGLAADATNPDAIRRIFKIKGRPQDNPLIVHISDISMLEELTTNAPQIAYKLAKAFWPGPLTIVLPKSKRVPYEISAGLDTVAIRMPDHDVAVRLINESGVPIAAPSANKSGSPSPTTANHVYDDLNGHIPIILDGGNCKIGLESTVVKIENDEVIILRPGIVTIENIKANGFTAKLASGVFEPPDDNAPTESPGMKYKHYSPKAKVILVDSDINRFAEYANSNLKDGDFCLIFDDDIAEIRLPHLTYGGNSREQAEQLFTKLRELDKLNANRIFVRCPDKDGIGLAVYNRLLRAAGFEVVVIE